MKMKRVHTIDELIRQLRLAIYIIENGNSSK